MALTRSLRIVVPVLVAAAGLAGVTVRAPVARADICSASPQSVACENTKPGTDSSQWDVSTTANSTIEGFATSMSVNVGQTVNFKINTPARSYTIDIYRMGYYGGKGARLIAGKIPISAHLPQAQPANCLSDSTTGIVDCGNWAVSARWQVPSAAVSGIYFAHLIRTDQGTSGDDAHIIFVVRNDASHSDMLLKTSDATWQAYNKWGLGNDFYTGDSSVAPGRAVKLSYNRPFSSRTDSPWGRDFVWANEYPMVRFLEGNGYDVTYTTDGDLDANGALLKNHKAFLSVGHDEYWSLNERTNVEAARDAGVNLAFFSGNEVFWKTRWENSTDGTNTPMRTLVTYKETWANAKIDPTSQWTGTWRDPRFSPPYDGGRPENQLTGGLTMVICCGVALQVPPADGLMRLWRNTSVATNALAGRTSTLADQTVGYEWDEDLDNGFRPPGDFELSTTTAGPGEGNGFVQQLLTDYGSTNTVEGTATHHLMEYRAPSGALVFGAGTVQWSWGLDPNHDGAISGFNPGNGPATADPAMRQATVNLFADMGVQPQSVTGNQTALGQTVAQQSVDTVAPTSTISSPAAGTTVANGKTITISGTASDVGGQVAGMEVSTDGGTTWHKATGRGTWTYSWDATGSGPVTIKSRAVDDSGNLETPAGGTTINVTCPCRLFGDSVVPATPDSGDATPLEAGVKFQSSVAGWIGGVRFYKSANNTGSHTITLWDANGNRLATGPVTGETASGWQTGTFPSAVQIQAGTTYIATYYAPNGHYSGDGNYFAVSGRNAPPLTAPRAADAGGNGVYRAGSTGFPDSTFQGGNYYVDPVFYLTQPPDTQPPVVTSATPLPGSSSVPPSATPAVTFSKAVVASSPSFSLKDGSAAVAGSASLDSANTVYTFTPSAALPAGHTLTATITGAADKFGNVMAPYTYSFTVAKATPPPGVCPCSIWTDATTPSMVTVNDPTSLELGVRFTADNDGTVSGIRFYKGASNTGTHTGTLWSAAGTQLATATFSGESTQGWQQVNFSSPVAVKAGVSYVASYHTSTGYYSADGGGLRNQVDNPPLHALGDANGAPDGVYAVGGHAFPNQSYNSADYWVDVVYTPSPDTTPPVVTSAAPSAGATSVPLTSKVSVTFGEPMQTSGAGTLTVTNPGGASVAGSSSFDSTAKVLTFTPSSALAAATKYTVSVSGFKDTDGNAMTGTTTSSFTTSGAAACPCTIWESDATPSAASVNDSGSVELGVKFYSDVAGSVTGVRFYKGAGNTGTHTGTLWDAAGNQLATGTFANETASGWQTLTFASPVAITAGTTYVVSYHAPNGHYAADGGYFGSPFDNSPLHALSNAAPGGNDVYNYTSATSFPNQTYGATNYWVDPIFHP